MRLRIAAAALVCAAGSLLSTTSSADSIKTYFDHRVNFANYHTYSWGIVEVFDGLSADRIKRSVNQFLQQKGWKEVPSGGQVTIMITRNLRSEWELGGFSDQQSDVQPAFPFCNAMVGCSLPKGSSPSSSPNPTESYEKVAEKCVVIHMFDTSSKSLLWRGVSRAFYSKNAKANRKRLEKDIAKMFKDFPPKSK